MSTIGTSRRLLRIAVIFWAAALATGLACAQGPAATAGPALARADGRMLNALVAGRPNQVEYEGSREYRVILSASLIFPFDRDDLSAQMMAQIEDAVHLVTQPEMAGWTVELVGYADDVGSDMHNDALSWRRADAARRYMVSRGVSPQRISVAAGGERVSPSHRPAIGQALNRRVDLVVSASPTALAAN